MRVSREVSLQAVQAELLEAAKYAAVAGLAFDDSDLSATDLRFYLTLMDGDGELFFAEFDCWEYPLHPPTVEFVSEDRQERGTKRLYPQDFHDRPCVCMRYNRKAYGRGAPHRDWRLVDWRLPTNNGVAIDTLALMVSDLESKIRQSSGRME